LPPNSGTFGEKEREKEKKKKTRKWEAGKLGFEPALAS
jgi:hypothetical protein